MRNVNPGREIKKGTRLTIACAGVAAVATLLFLFNPAEFKIFPLCFFYGLTGLRCPGCGTLRALHQLLHGNFWLAFKYNPLTVLLLPSLGYFLFLSVLSSNNEKYARAIFVRPWLIWTLLSAIILFWIIRNTPFYPFN